MMLLLEFGNLKETIGNILSNMMDSGIADNKKICISNLLLFTFYLYIYKYIKGSQIII